VPPEKTLPKQTPPEQAPHELTTDEVMLRAFGLPLDEDNEENERDKADEEDGSQHQDRAQQDEGQQDGGEHQDGPICMFLFLVKFLFSDKFVSEVTNTCFVGTDVLS
jgi:hypothetical protein